MKIEKTGEIVDKIPVEISYRIIELFSAGLYSSPNKAFEELVCNSYDADANQVAVYVPSDLTRDGAIIWVADDGTSMDTSELKKLWMIGESDKKDKKFLDKKKRKLIGQFGIGKLSTYILANNLTYICKKDDKYLAVTMEYDKIDDQTKSMELDERELTEEQAKSIVEPLSIQFGKNIIPFKLFGIGAKETWTISILSSLKPKAMEIREGRLKWVLETALPLNPKFQLFYNGTPLTSSKIKKPVKKTWMVGLEDTTATFRELEAYADKDGIHKVDFENLKGVHGVFELYEDSLVDGSKSSELGRSHGIFLMVRNRLINLDDPLLGMPQFSHGAFNRARITIHADGLNGNITSTREAVKESAAFRQLKDYIKTKFNNEVVTFHKKEKERNERAQSISYRLSQTSLLASKRPLFVFAKNYFDGKISNPSLIIAPSKENEEELLNELQKDLLEDENIIKDVDWKYFSPQDPIAKFNLETGILSISLSHPFVANYYDAYKDTLPLQFVAITEVLTEAHLYELEISESQIHSIMSRRDQTLRDLSLSDRENAPAVAMFLKDTLSDSVGLEEALHRSFLALGFESVKMGGPGKPDGQATAVLGYRSEDDNMSYSFTYDAKSTSHEKIQAKTASLSTINKHKRDWSADYALVVAKEFAGSDDEFSTISDTAKNDKVTVMRANDLIRLLLLSAPKQIGIGKLRDLFETCYAPSDVTAWIDEIENTPSIAGPYKEILEEIYELQKTDKEPPKIASVRIKVNMKDGISLSSKEISNYLNSLKVLAPGFINIEDEVVGISGTPEKVMGIIQNAVSHVPTELTQIYLDAFDSQN